MEQVVTGRDIDVRVAIEPALRVKASHLKEEMKNAVIDNLRYAHEHGIDRPEIANWIWPY